TTEEELAAAFERAAEVASEVIVERQLAGDDYRVLVVAGRVVAVSRRVPCHVTGDGTHTVEELIERANRDPLRGEGHEKPLTRIVIDDELTLQLHRAGMSLASVPAHDQRVTLRGCANLSTG